MTTRLRTTISITPETHEVFKRMAEAGNMSVSRAMGEWLADTSDAAEMIVLKMEEAKRAPITVMREMQAMLAGMTSEVASGMDQIRQLARRDVRASGRPAGSGGGLPPSSNTGVLVPPSPLKSTTPRRAKKP